MRSYSTLLNRPREILLDSLPNTADQNLFLLWRLWEQRGWTEDAPDRSLLTFEVLKPWLGHISIYETRDQCSSFHVKLDGTAIVDIAGQDWTRRSAAAIDDTFGTSLVPSMRDAVLMAKPVIHSIMVFQHEYLQATRLLLPVRPLPFRPPIQVFLVLYLDRTET